MARPAARLRSIVSSSTLSTAKRIPRTSVAPTLLAASPSATLHSLRPTVTAAVLPAHHRPPTIPRNSLVLQPPAPFAPLNHLAGLRFIFAPTFSSASEAHSRRIGQSRSSPEADDTKTRHATTAVSDSRQSHAAYPGSVLCRPASIPDNLNMASASIKAAHAPHIRPLSPALPLASDFARQQIKKQQSNNFHSSSLHQVQNAETMGNSVNRTNLHPGGVQYVLPRVPPFSTMPHPRGPRTPSHNTHFADRHFAGHSGSTRRSRRSCTRKLTLTMTELRS